MALTVSGMNSSMAGNLFSSIGSGNNGLYGMLGDYSSIKSGSYGKLLGAYYREAGVQGTSGSKSSGTAAADNTSRGYYESYLKEQEIRSKGKPSKNESTSGSVTSKDSPQAINSKVASESQNMLDSLDKLKSSDLFRTQGGNFNTSDIVSAVKSYADAYNGVLDSSAKSTVSGVSSNVSSMKNYTTSYSKELSDIGVTIGDDGKLSVNEDKLKSADMNKVKSLFDRGSYGYSVRTNAYMANYYSKQAQSTTTTYGSNGSYSLSDLVSTYTDKI